MRICLNGKKYCMILRKNPQITMRILVEIKNVKPVLSTASRAATATFGVTGLPRKIIARIHLCRQHSDIGCVLCKDSDCVLIEQIFLGLNCDPVKKEEVNEDPCTKTEWTSQNCYVEHHE